MMDISKVEKDEVVRQELIKIQKGDGCYNPKTGVYKWGEAVWDLTKTNGEAGVGYPPILSGVIEYERQNSTKEIKSKDMRTTARGILMEGNEGQRFRDVIYNLDEDIILDCMEEYADYKIANSAKEIVEQPFETLFDTLERAKNNIADKFSNHYFENSTDYYWIGEVLSINDEFIDLENIEFAITYDLKEQVLFKYLSKPRKYNLGVYCLGKVGRKNKNKEELKKCKERVELSKQYFQDALHNLGINKTR